MIHPPLTRQADEAFCIRARRLHKQIHPSNPQAALFEEKLRALLAKRGVAWDDLNEVLSHTDMDDRWIEEDPSEALWKHNLIDLIMSVISQYVGTTDDECLAVALWVLHTYVYDNYTYTPRLALLSPVFGCGKSTLLSLIEKLAHDPRPRLINSTAAALYRLMDEEPNGTILMDEANNQHLLEDKTMRAVLNANRHNDNLVRATGRQHSAKFYRAFTPLAIGAVGKLPNDLHQRCIVINMRRHPPDAPLLGELDERDSSFLMLVGLVRERIEKWRGEANLNRHPDNPVKNRHADNWRPLLAIADSLDHGDKARELALRMTAGLPDDDPRVYLLRDIRIVFDNLDVDRIFTVALLEELYKLEDASWSGWTGLDDDRPPHRITASELARMLKPFGIAPKTVAQLGSRGTRGPTAQGYWREWFEQSWASYCPETPRQPVELRVIDSSNS
jgi:hypothetical protein